jgi:hypothetical protein
MPSNMEILKQVDKLIYQMEQLRLLVKESPSEMPKDAIEKSARGLCTYCAEKLGDGRQFRGAHEKCYKRVNRAINSGEITDAQAVARGYILPGDKGGRPVAANDPIAAKALPPKPPKTTKPKQGPRKQGS